MNKLGFGFLRLPGWGKSGGDIGLELLNRMVDVYLERGKTYFDIVQWEQMTDGRTAMEVTQGAYDRSPEESRVRIVQRLRMLCPEAFDDDLEKLIR